MLCRLQFWRSCVFIQEFAAAVDRTEGRTGPKDACRPAAKRWPITSSWLASPSRRAQDQDPCLPAGAANTHLHLSADECGMQVMHAVVVQTAQRDLLVLSQQEIPNDHCEIPGKFGPHCCDRLR